jgi:Carboxypeptidase regulatory-like domain
MRKRKSKTGDRKEPDPLIPLKLSSRRLREGTAFRRLLVAAAGCLLALSVLPGLSSAKQKQPPTKTIQGHVLDASSTPIVGAAVQLTDVTTGKTLAMYSEAGGRYVFTHLKPTDDYKVQATYRGQQSEARRASSLNDENLVVLNLTIPPPTSQ